MIRQERHGEERLTGGYLVDREALDFATAQAYRVK